MARGPSRNNLHHRTTCVSRCLGWALLWMLLEKHSKDGRGPPEFWRTRQLCPRSSQQGQVAAAHQHKQYQEVWPYRQKLVAVASGGRLRISYFIDLFSAGTACGVATWPVSKATYPTLATGGRADRLDLPESATRSLRVPNLQDPRSGQRFFLARRWRDAIRPLPERPAGDTRMVNLHTRFSISKNLVLAGVLLMLGGDFMFALNDAMGKWLVARFSVGQVLLIRSLGAFIVLGPMIAVQDAASSRTQQAIEQHIGTAPGAWPRQEAGTDGRAEATEDDRPVEASRCRSRRRTMPGAICMPAQDCRSSRPVLALFASRAICGARLETVLVPGDGGEG